MQIVVIGSSLLPLTIVVLVLAGVSFLPRREVGHPLVALVRVLFPSWRFFDDVQVAPVLLVRTASGDGAFGEWLPLLSPPRREWPLSLAWNPGGNLHLAEQVLLERLLADVAEWDETRGDDVDDLVSYELVVNLVRARLPAASGASTRFQFKLAEAGDDGTRPGADLLISREHTT